MKIADLREEMGLSLEAFATEIGQKSRGRMSVIERENRCSLAVALRIEELSACNGVPRIDAAELCDDVRKAREAVHGADNAPAAGAASTGQSDQMSGQSDQEFAA
ncbi:MAG: hypothetical protein WBZ57_02405 [Pseudomonas graminis]